MPVIARWPNMNCYWSWPTTPHLP